MTDDRPLSSDASLRWTMLVSAVAGALVLAASTIVGGIFRWDWAPPPFAYRDVAGVHFLSALPLAAMLATMLRRRLSDRGAIAAAILLLGGGIVALIPGAFGIASISTSKIALYLGNLFRGSLAFAFASAVLLAATTRLKTGQPRATRRVPFVAGALASGILIIVPMTYVVARVHRDTAHLRQLLEDNRWGEARQLVSRLSILDPESRWGWDTRTVRRLDVSKMSARVEFPLLSPSASDDDRLQRSFQLAVAGRSDEAVAMFHSMRNWRESWTACNLLGTIHETRGEWKAALDAYRRARQLADEPEIKPWNADPVPRASQALKGIAYCERKLGRYAAAESAYLDLLRINPTAETHFLLAQFYEDTQQSAQARHHARQAMIAWPERYQEPGQRLIDNLLLNHFGCWGVYSAEFALSRNAVPSPPK